MDSKKLYVRNIDPLTTRNHIESLFSIYGNVHNIFLKRRKGYGLVSMITPSEAQEVKKMLDGEVLWGRPLNIHVLSDSYRDRIFYLIKRLSI